MAIVSARDDAGNFTDSKSCRDHLRPFLRWMLDRQHEHGGVTEVRLLQTQPFKSVHSGYWDPDHLDELIELLSPVERSKIPFGQHPRIGEANIYVCLHPADPKLIARSAYEFTKCAGTSDDDIVAYD